MLWVSSARRPRRQVVQTLQLHNGLSCGRVVAALDVQLWDTGISRDGCTPVKSYSAPVSAVCDEPYMFGECRERRGLKQGRGCGNERNLW